MQYATSLALNVFHTLTSSGLGCIQIGINSTEENMCKDIIVLEENCDVDLICSDYCRKHNNLVHTQLLNSFRNYILNKATRKKNKNPIFVDAAEIEHVSVIDYMIRYGQDVNETSEFLQTALHAAATANKLSAVKIILDTNQAKINENDAFGNTPLHCAVQ